MLLVDAGKRSPFGSNSGFREGLQWSSVCVSTLKLGGTTVCLYDSDYAFFHVRGFIFGGC